MKYILSGHYIDARLEFATREEAEKQLKEWIASDEAEFGEFNENDYYIVEAEG